jgi:spermidine synthase
VQQAAGWQAELAKEEESNAIRSQFPRGDSRTDRLRYDRSVPAKPPRSLRPAKAGKARPAPEPPITLSEQGGVRYLHFGSEWVQGAMSIRRPWSIEIDYVAQMMAWLLFLEPSSRMLQLGLGAGALTRWCWRHLPQASVEVVESSESVIRVARQHFCVPPDDDRLRVHCAEAGAFMSEAGAASGSGRQGASWGIIQADLYDRHARGPVCDSLGFYRDCRSALDPAAGILVVNLFGEHASYSRNLRRIGEAFEGRVLTLPPVPAGNVVALAFSGPSLTVPVERLRERASFVQSQWRLPARAWARALLETTRARSSGEGAPDVDMLVV